MLQLNFGHWGLYDQSFYASRQFYPLRHTRSLLFMKVLTVIAVNIYSHSLVFLSVDFVGILRSPFCTLRNNNYLCDLHQNTELKQLQLPTSMSYSWPSFSVTIKNCLWRKMKWRRSKTTNPWSLASDAIHGVIISPFHHFMARIWQLEKPYNRTYS